MSLNAVTIFFVRHGQTDWNAEHRLQGNRDVPLNDNGRSQANRNGLVLNQIIANPSDWAFVSSPLSRAVETMEIILQQIPHADQGRSGNWTYGTHQDLREIEFGNWEGLIWSEVQTANPDLARQWKADRWLTPIPGGESYKLLSARVSRWLKSVDRNTVVVSHGGVSRCLRGLVSEIPDKEIPRLEVPQ
ncbi:MAG: histidine phosphatase family protein, partial [Desulfobulbia bacterium]